MTSAELHFKVNWDRGNLSGGGIEDTVYQASPASIFLFFVMGRNFHFNFHIFFQPGASLLFLGRGRVILIRGKGYIRTKWDTLLLFYEPVHKTKAGELFMPGGTL